MPIGVILVPCSRCDHRNRVAKTVKQSYRLILLDSLPPCKKCGAPLRGGDYNLPRTGLIEQVRRELERDKARLRVIS